VTSIIRRKWRSLRWKCNLVGDWHNKGGEIMERGIEEVQEVFGSPSSREMREKEQNKTQS